MHTCRSCASDWSVDVFGIFDMFGMTCDNERRHLKRESEAMCNLNASIWSFKHQRKCFGDFHDYVSPKRPRHSPERPRDSWKLRLWCEFALIFFESYTLALKLKFCPKGPPDWTTEESAAHHFHWKTYFDTPDIHPNDRGTHLKTCSFEFQSLRKNPKNLIQISTENQFKCIFLDARILKNLQMELIFYVYLHFGFKCWV